MSEVFTKTFFTIGTVEPEQKMCFIPGIKGDIPGLWECKPAVWVWYKSAKLIGASLVLLCAPTDAVEIYACVCRETDIGIEHNFAAMKKEHLFYAQRDSYAPCAGISDLAAWQLLPEGEYFSVSKDKPIYVKVGVYNMFKDRKIDFDAIVNLYYKK